MQLLLFKLMVEASFSKHQKEYRYIWKVIWVAPLSEVNIVSSGTQVTIACDAVLNASSAYKKQEPESWDEEIQVSRHARSLRQLENGVRIPPR